MSILYERALLLAKVESTFRTDAAPTALLDAILVEDPKFSVKVTQLTRTPVRTDLSPLPNAAGRKVASVEFAVEVRGNGDATHATAPMIGRLLRGCAMAETQQGGASPTGWLYSPVSSNMDSLTLYVYYDGKLHTMTGARGTWSVDAAGGQLAKFKFTFTGDYYDPTDTAMPLDAVYETTLPVQVQNAELVVDSDTTLAASKFSFNIANEVSVREDINASNAYAGAIITGRKPSGSFDPEAVLEATHPAWSILSQGTQVPVSVQIGGAAGNTVAFAAPAAQYEDVKYAQRTQIRTYDITLHLARVVGNDELTVLFT